MGGDNPGLITTTDEPPHLEHGYHYYVQLNEEEGIVSSARYSIPPAGLGKGESLTSHGDVRTTACEWPDRTGTVTAPRGRSPVQKRAILP